MSFKQDTTNDLEISPTHKYRNSRILPNKKSKYSIKFEDPTDDSTQLLSRSGRFQSTSGKMKLSDDEYYEYYNLPLTLDDIVESTLNKSKGKEEEETSEIVSPNVNRGITGTTLTNSEKSIEEDNNDSYYYQSPEIEEDEGPSLSKIENYCCDYILLHVNNDKGVLAKYVSTLLGIFQKTNETSSSGVPIYKKDNLNVFLFHFISKYDDPLENFGIYYVSNNLPSNHQLSYIFYAIPVDQRTCPNGDFQKAGTGISNIYDDSFQISCYTPVQLDPSCCKIIRIWYNIRKYPGNSNHNMIGDYNYDPELSSQYSKPIYKLTDNELYITMTESGLPGKSGWIITADPIHEKYFPLLYLGSNGNCPVRPNVMKQSGLIMDPRNGEYVNLEKLRVLCSLTL